MVYIWLGFFLATVVFNRPFSVSVLGIFAFRQQVSSQQTPAVTILFGTSTHLYNFFSLESLAMSNHMHFKHLQICKRSHLITVSYYIDTRRRHGYVSCCFTCMLTYWPIISCRCLTGLEQSSTSRPILIVSHHFSARTENIPVPL